MSNRYSSPPTAATTSPATEAVVNDDIDHEARSLERKLELLEARFTMPPPGNHPPRRSSISSVTSTRSASPPDNQAAVNQALSSAPNSQHSFGFDQPTLSRLSSTTTTTAATHHSESPVGISSTTSTDSTSTTVASNIPLSSIRQKKRKRHSISSLQAVQLAAERQMRKVAAAGSPTGGNFVVSTYNNLQQQHDQDTRLTTAASSSSTSVASQASHADRSRSPPVVLSNTCNQNTSSSLTIHSNQTMRTSHVAHASGTPPIVAQLPTKVVKESPPPPPSTKTPLRSPPMQQQLQPPPNPTTPQNLISSSTVTKDKRKSIPVKRELHTVQTAFDKTTTNTTGNKTTSTTSHNHKKTPTRTPSDSRKRTRLQFNNLTDNNKKTLSPIANRSSRDGIINDNSRSSNPPMIAKTNNNSKPLKPPPSNNKLIDDFFTTAIKKNKNVTSSNSAAKKVPATGSNKATKPSSSVITIQDDHVDQQQSQQEDISQTENYHNNNTNQQQQQQQHSKEQKQSHPTQNVGSDKGKKGIDGKVSGDDNAEKERLRVKCQELEQLCKDKDDQLKAVSNNRTIMHTAIQSALRQREAEIEEMKKSKYKLMSRTGKAIEDLIRSETFNEAKEIRDRLASDSARLGRIAHTRAGMRSVETWEEGHASKTLQQRRNELMDKLSILEHRQRTAKQVTKQFIEADKENSSSGKATTTTNENNKSSGKGKKESASSAITAKELVVAGIRLKDNLDAMEALESVRLHLNSIRRKIKELEVEEHKLNEEKVAHIRALKTVASEDASRFRKRPKLHNRYILRFLLGKGGFSEVWRAYDLIELREVAVKIHQLDPRWPEEKKNNYTKHVAREYEIHRNVRHPRIVSLYDVFEIDTDSFATVLECCNGTDLDTLLKKQRRLPERDGRAILLQILSGMKYLSHPSSDGKRQGIIHYDLKPGNILFDEYGDAKITDFGLSKIVDATDDPSESMELTSQGAGTYWYLPPECFMNIPMATDGDESSVELPPPVRISNKVDVWSIGVIYYQMLYGRRPFGEGQSQDKLLSDRTMLNAREVNFPDKPKVSELGKQFIRECLTYDQTFRPTIGQICKNKYVLGNHFLLEVTERK